MKENTNDDCYCGCVDHKTEMNWDVSIIIFPTAPASDKITNIIDCKDFGPHV